MAFEVTMPRLGWSMETGKLAEWLKKDGDRVEAGEILFSVEGDKAIQEVEALESGILRIPPDTPPPGQEMPVGTVLAYIVQPGERAPFESRTAAAPISVTSALAPESPLLAPEPVSAPGRTRHGLPAISPRARRVAQELGVEWAALTGSGRSGRIVERDVRQAAHARQPEPQIRVSPVARRLAKEAGINLAELAAQQPGRSIEREDVAEAIAVRVAAAPVAPAPAAPADQVTPITNVRRTIAERMAASAQTAAAVTLTTEADATELVRLRDQLKNDAAQPVPTYNDVLAKLVAQALTEHPALNAHLEGDTILQATAISIGIAVDTERGLLVPVLHDVQSKSLRQIAAESAALIDKARNGRVTVDELRGGTFTITNLGMYDIDAFTPIINLPECAILGVGRIVPKQVVVDAEAGRLAIRHMAFLSLTFDHRLVDGAPAARFLQRVKQYVEKPYLWLVR